MTSRASEPVAAPVLAGADVLDQVAAPLVVFDADGTIVRWSARATDLLGWRADEMVGRPIWEVDVERESPPSALVVEVTRSGGVWEGELPLRCADGSSLLVWLVAAPVRDERGEIVGSTGIALDVTERHNTEAERAILLGRERAARLEAEEARRVAEWTAERIARLQAVTAALSDALTLQEVFGVVVEQGIAALGAAAGAVAVLEGDGHVDVVASKGYDEDVIASWHRAAISDPLPLSTAIRDGEPVWAGGGEGESDDALPLIWNGRVLGGLVLRFAGDRPRSEEDVAFMTTLAQQCSQALERARLFEAQQLTQRRLTFLAEASEILASSLDYEETVTRVVQRVVPAIADWCIVHVVDEPSRVRLLSAAFADRRGQTAHRTLEEERPADLDAAPGVAAVIRTATTEFHPDDTDGLLDALARDDTERAALARLGLTSGLIVPLVVRGRTLGALSLGMASRSRRTELADLALAEDLSRRLAAAVDNSRLYTERSDVARKLQESLLPPSLPRVPGAAVAVRYRAAGAGNEVGGDFYDLFDTGDGAWAVVVGDVCGKGPEAAAVTGLARHTVRAIAMQERRPARILAGLNEALLAQQTERFCTVCCVRLVPTSTGARITVASGGHPLPLVVRTDGRVENTGRPGMPVGMFPDLELLDIVEELHPGDAIVLHTDGVTERHEGQRIFGDERLAALLSTLAGRSAEEIAGEIERAVVDFQPGPLRDDMAVLVVQVVA